MYTTKIELSRKQSAAYLGISLPTIGRHIKHGLIPYRRIGKFIRIAQSDLDKLDTSKPKKGGSK
jgi:excisionase family DNA binding protein